MPGCRLLEKEVLNTGLPFTFGLPGGFEFGSFGLSGDDSTFGLQIGNSLRTTVLLVQIPEPSTLLLTVLALAPILRRRPPRCR